MEEMLERTVRSQAAIDVPCVASKFGGAREIDVARRAAVDGGAVAGWAVEGDAVDPRRRRDVEARHVPAQVAAAVGSLRAGELLRAGGDPSLRGDPARRALIGAAEAVAAGHDRRQRLGVRVGDDAGVVDQDVTGTDTDGARAHLEDLPGLRVDLHVERQHTWLVPGRTRRCATRCSRGSCPGRVRRARRVDGIELSAALRATPAANAATATPRSTQRASRRAKSHSVPQPAQFRSLLCRWFGGRSAHPFRPGR